MKISVCLATYNGEKYLREQLNSILFQLNYSDEIVIVDDCSSDSTVDVIKSYSDERILLYINNKNSGVVKSFEKAISLSSGDFIFLSDQDDIWTDKRLEIMLNSLISSKSILLTSNIASIDAFGNIGNECYTNIKSIDSKKYLKNILLIYRPAASYFGCAMAFSSQLKQIILPFPNCVECHDLWIALAGNCLRSNIHIDDITLLHRLHGENNSLLRRSFFKKILARIKETILIIILLSRIYVKKQIKYKVVL